jgi:hypothetical protein
MNFARFWSELGLQPCQGAVGLVIDHDYLEIAFELGKPEGWNLAA